MGTWERASGPRKCWPTPRREEWDCQRALELTFTGAGFLDALVQLLNLSMLRRRVSLGTRPVAGYSHGYQARRRVLPQVPGLSQGTPTMVGVFLLQTHRP